MSGERRMKIEIKHRFSGAVLFAYQAPSLSLAVSAAIESGANLRGADLRGADLREVDLREVDLIGVNLSGADLSGADLRGVNLSGADLSRVDLSGAGLSRADLSGAGLSRADLRGVNLSGADLRGAGLIVLHLPRWTAYVGRDETCIGCERHANDKWLSFDDARINRMDSEALAWWRVHKPLIEAAMAAVEAQEKDE